MKTKHLVWLLSLIIVWPLAAQKKEILEKTETHFQRLDSIRNHLETHLKSQLKALPSDSIPPEQLAQLVDNYADDWDYALYWEMEHYRKDLGIRAPQAEEEDKIGEARQIFKKIIKIIPKEDRGVKKPKKPQKPKSPIHTKKKHQLRTSIESVFRWGLNNTLDPTDSTTYRSWGSKYVALGFEAQIPLGAKAPAYLLMGVGVQWNKLSANGNYYHRVVNGRTVLTRHSSALSRNKLRTSWFYGNLGLQINLGRKLALGVEGYGKIRIGSLQKLSYSDAYATYDVKEKRDFGETKINYGGNIFFGTRSFQISVGMDALPYFRDQSFRLYQVGIILR